jgi:hypothetical protein
MVETFSPSAFVACFPFASLSGIHYWLMHKTNQTMNFVVNVYDSYIAHVIDWIPRSSNQ